MLLPSFQVLSWPVLNICTCHYYLLTQQILPFNDFISGSLLTLGIDAREEERSLGKLSGIGIERRGFLDEPRTASGGLYHQALQLFESQLPDPQNESNGLSCFEEIILRVKTLRNHKMEITSLGN